MTRCREFPDALSAESERPVIAGSWLSYGSSDPLEEAPDPEYANWEGPFLVAAPYEPGVGRAAIFDHRHGASLSLVAAELHRNCIPPLSREALHRNEGRAVLNACAACLRRFARAS